MAMVRDDCKVVLQMGIESSTCIYIYSLSGKFVQRIEWNGPRVLQMGWTSKDELVVVDELGWAHMYSSVGWQSDTTCSTFSLGPACEQEKIGEIEIFSSGICARTEENHLWCIHDFETRMPIRLADPGPPGCAVDCFTVVPPPLTAEGAIEVIVAVDDGLALVDQHGSISLSCSCGPFVSLTASPNGLYVAGVTAHEEVYILSINEDKVLARVSVFDAIKEDDDEFINKSMVPSGIPKFFAWCGTDAVVAYWAEAMTSLVMTVEGEYAWVDAGIVEAVSSEIDGVYLLSQSSVRFCRVVPESSKEVLEPGSICPGALLHDSRKLLDMEDVRATAQMFELINNGSLRAAAQSCFDAAGFETNPRLQESLLRATCFGLSFLPLTEGGKKVTQPIGTRILELARSLRILNAVRDSSVGFPLTMAQFGSLGLPRLLERLCNASHFLLALKICTSVDYSPDMVVLTWAKRKISSSAMDLSDEELYLALKSKLQDFPEISWSSIASHALKKGRKELSILLIGMEKRAAGQIPLLLQLGELDAAIKKAGEDGSADIIFETVHARHQKFRSIEPLYNERPSIVAMQRLYEHLVRGSSLIELHEKLENYEACALECVQQAVLLSGSQQSTTWWERSRNYFNASEKNARDDKFFANASAAAHRLACQQVSLEQSTNRDGFVGLSVYAMLRRCLQIGLKNEATKIARDFKVPEKQFILIQADILAAAHDWAAIQHLASKLHRKSPVDPEDIVEKCMQHGAPVMALKGIIDSLDPNEVTPERKAGLYSALGLHTEAAMIDSSISAQSNFQFIGNIRDVVESKVESWWK